MRAPDRHREGQRLLRPRRGPVSSLTERHLSRSTLRRAAAMFGRPRTRCARRAGAAGGRAAARPTRSRRRWRAPRGSGQHGVVRARARERVREPRRSTNHVRVLLPARHPSRHPHALAAACGRRPTPARPRRASTSARTRPAVARNTAEAGVADDCAAAGPLAALTAAMRTRAARPARVRAGACAGMEGDAWGRPPRRPRAVQRRGWRGAGECSSLPRRATRHYRPRRARRAAAASRRGQISSSHARQRRSTRAYARAAAAGWPAASSRTPWRSAAGAR